MKLRTSFFDPTVLKKDIARFAPVWVVYTIMGLLIQSTMMGDLPYRISSALADTIGTLMPVLNCGYGILVALLLFGDLFNSRLCNALHAMPLRREAWFVTHFTAGILFALVPNLVLTLIFMLMMESLWYTALIWLLGAMLSFLFFFGLAVFSVMITGSRFGALTMYGFFNFASMEIWWVVYELVLPFLYGVRLQDAAFATFSPVVYLLSYGEPGFELEHACDTACRFYEWWGIARDCSYAFTGFTGSWGYLAGTALAGIALTAAALLLYRRRQLEVAGDFAAIGLTRYLVETFGTLGCGMVVRMFGFGDEGMEYVFLFVGLVVGFFLLQMVLQRRTKVFDRKNWIKLGAVVLAVILLLVISVTDLFGIERRVPKPASVEKVLVADGDLSEYQLRRIEQGYTYHDSYVFLSDPADIDNVRSAHREMLKSSASSNYYHHITLCYYLKNGTKVVRSYRVGKDAEAFLGLADYFRAESLFGVSNKEEVRKYLSKIEWKSTLVQSADMEKLVDLLWQDGENGLLRQEWSYHEGLKSTVLYLHWNEGKNDVVKEIEVWEDAQATWPYLEGLAKANNFQNDWAW